MSMTKSFLFSTRNQEMQNFVSITKNYRKKWILRGITIFEKSIITKTSEFGLITLLSEFFETPLNYNLVCPKSCHELL